MKKLARTSTVKKLRSWHPVPSFVLIAKSLQLCLTLWDPMDCSPPVHGIGLWMGFCPLSMGFSKQEYWIGLPWPPPEYLPDPGIELTSLMSPALADRFFTTEPPGVDLWCHHFMANRWEKVEAVTDLFSWAPKSLQTVTTVTKLKDACSLEEKLWQTQRAY